MALINIQADLSGCARELKRIADLLEDYIHPQVNERHFDKSRVTISQINPRSRWEAETEAARQRGEAESVAGVMPRR